MHAAGGSIGIPGLHGGGFIRVRRRRSGGVLSGIWRDRDRARTAGRPGPAECTQYYQPPNKANVLEIIQTAGKLSRSETPPGGGHPIRVRGHTGHASRNVITWREDGLTDYILMIGDQSPQDLPQLLTTQQLIAIAESAPDPG